MEHFGFDYETYGMIGYGMIGWSIDRESFHSMSKDMYSHIKDNEYIPNDIRESWRDMCVTEADVMDLCN